jgi:serine/threonine-protein kinase
MPTTEGWCIATSSHTTLWSAASGLVKVADFGIASLLSEVAQPDEALQPGTVQYSAPEQIRNAGVTPRTDIYSLGVVLYEAMTGFLPFPAESTAAMAEAQLRDEPVPPSTLHTDVPPAMDRVILRAMAKKPARPLYHGGRTRQRAAGL